MRPLEGIKVIDFTQAYSGPFATMHLADFGAEVIKIERAGSGDQARYWAPFKNGHSGYYASFNRGKKSVALDLRDERDKDIIRMLVKDADVVVENFKVGTLEKMGLGYEDLKLINPEIIYASISGYGINGPMAKLAAYDIVVAGQSGIMDITGFPDGPPLKIGPSIGDNYTGTTLTLGICMALFHKKRTGQGQRLDVAMMDSLFSIMDSQLLEYTVLGNIPKRSGNADPGIAPYDVYVAKDGYCAIGISSDKQFAKLCEVMGRPELSQDPKYIYNEDRVKNYPELKPIIEDYTRQKTRAELEETLIAAGLSVGPVLTVPEVMAHPQTAAREMMVEVNDPGVGTMIIPGIPIKMSSTPGEITSGSPLLGQHTEEILKSIISKMKIA